jgi:hypothetical protein
MPRMRAVALTDASGVPAGCSDALRGRFRVKVLDPILSERNRPPRERDASARCARAASDPRSANLNGWEPARKGSVALERVLQYKFQPPDRTFKNQLRVDCESSCSSDPIAMFSKRWAGRLTLTLYGVRKLGEQPRPARKSL